MMTGSGTSWSAIFISGVAYSDYIHLDKFDKSRDLRMPLSSLRRGLGVTENVIFYWRETVPYNTWSFILLLYIYTPQKKMVFD